jgi:hypothetical protein
MAPAERDPDIPRHIAAPSREWLRHLRETFAFSPSEWSLALLAAETRDRAATARRQLGREGLTIVNRFGEVKPHPCVTIARDATALYARLLAQLDLDDEGGQ